jgi:hypothetical protein
VLKTHRLWCVIDASEYWLMGKFDLTNNPGVTVREFFSHTPRNGQRAGSHM